jgi:hypothetical protein
MIKQALVDTYFAAEERGDVDAVVALCADDVVVRNAAQPPQRGLDGVRAYVTSFRDRTDARQFQVVAAAESDDVVFAAWKARLVFKAGLPFGAVISRKPFDVELTGICRFKLNQDGKVCELDVYHETTSVMQRAVAASH